MTNTPKDVNDNRGNQLNPQDPKHPKSQGYSDPVAKNMSKQKTQENQNNPPGNRNK